MSTLHPCILNELFYFFEITFQFLQSAVDADVMKFFQKEFGLTDEEAKTDPVRLYIKVCIC